MTHAIIFAILLPLATLAGVYFWNMHIEKECKKGNHSPYEFEGGCYCNYCGEEIK